MGRMCSEEDLRGERAFSATPRNPWTWQLWLYWAFFTSSVEAFLSLLTLHKFFLQTLLISTLNLSFPLKPFYLHLAFCFRANPTVFFPSPHHFLLFSYNPRAPKPQFDKLKGHGICSWIQILAAKISTNNEKVCMWGIASGWTLPTSKEGDSVSFLQPPHY